MQKKMVDEKIFRWLLGVEELGGKVAIIARMVYNSTMRIGSRKPVGD